jgi:hydroxyacylglutathione hydrolase
MNAPNPPMRAAIVPVTAFQQNCTLLWCTETNKAAFVDPGGDLDKLKEAVKQTGVEVEKILVTHGHMDHCGQAGMLAKELGVPIEGPHEDDRFWIAQFAEDGARFGMVGEVFEPDRWLVDGDTVTVGNLTIDVIHCPGHTPGHVVFHHAPSKFAIVGDVMFPGIDRPHRFPARQPSAIARFDHAKAVAARRRHDLPAGPWRAQQFCARTADQSRSSATWC